MEIVFESIGVIHSPFKTAENMPIQPTSEASRSGVVEVFPAYAEGLKDLEGFSHIYLLYYFHRLNADYHKDGAKMLVTPFLDTVPRGLFATRAPRRPNPMGLSLVQLERVEGNRLYIAGLDVMDGTPLLDIKPYIPVFEPEDEVRIGWVEAARAQVRKRKSDRRFE